MPHPFSDQMALHSAKAARVKAPDEPMLPGSRRFASVGGMWMRGAVRLLALAGTLTVLAWACDSTSGPRDRNYNTDVGAGYGGPDGIDLAEDRDGGEEDTEEDMSLGDGVLPEQPG
jgi:hypothetical protein